MPSLGAQHATLLGEHLLAVGVPGEQAALPACIPDRIVRAPSTAPRPVSQARWRGRSQRKVLQPNNFNGLDEQRFGGSIRSGGRRPAAPTCTRSSTGLTNPHRYTSPRDASPNLRRRPPRQRAPAATDMSPSSGRIPRGRWMASAMARWCGGRPGRFRPPHGLRARPARVKACLRVAVTRSTGMPR